MYEVAARGAMRIVGIDPGLAAVGWGVIEKKRGRLVCVAHGCIETSREDERSRRLFEIYDCIAAVLEKHKPQLAAMETLFFSRNVTSALGVAEARGILSLACYQRGIVMKEYSPNMLKQTVTGMARADKVQVQEMVRFLLGLADIPKPDHAADALAAAICAANYEDIITK